MKQQKNSLYLPKPTRSTRKIVNNLMTVASGEINLQSKHNLIFLIVKVKGATSANFMAHAIPFFNILFESNASIYILHLFIKKNNINVPTAFGE